MSWEWNEKKNEWRRKCGLGLKLTDLKKIGIEVIVRKIEREDGGWDELWLKWVKIDWMKREWVVIKIDWFVNEMKERMIEGWEWVVMICDWNEWKNDWRKREWVVIKIDWFGIEMKERKIEGEGVGLD